MLSPLPLPAILDASVLREAMAAVLGDGVGASAGSAVRAPVSDADVSDVSGPGAKASEAGVSKAVIPDPGVPEPVVPKAGVTKAEASEGGVPKPQATVTVSPDAAASAGAPTVRSAPTEAEGRSSLRRPLVSALIPPTPARSRRPVGQRYRPPMAGASHVSGPGTDLRHRIRREPGDVLSLSRSGATVAAVLLAMSIMIALLVYYIVIDFLNFVARLIP